MMAKAIIIGVAILGLVLAFAIYASRAMRKTGTNQPPPDGSGAEAPGGDGGDGGGDGD
jgi:hypothetical protein